MSGSGTHRFWGDVTEVKTCGFGDTWDGHNETCGEERVDLLLAPHWPSHFILFYFLYFCFLIFNF